MPAMMGEGTTTSVRSDAELAAIANVPVEAITAFRTGVPDWRLKANVSAVAQAVGADPLALKAAIARAERKVTGRQGDPATLQASYGGLI